MRDYFRQFLKSANLGSLDAATDAAPSAPNVLSTAVPTTYDKIKTHAIWAAATAGIGFVCWKAGQYHATYQLIKKKLSE